MIPNTIAEDNIIYIPSGAILIFVVKKLKTIKIFFFANIKSYIILSNKLKFKKKIKKHFIFKSLIDLLLKIKKLKLKELEACWWD